MVSTTPQDDRGTKRDALVGGVDEVAVTADLDDMGRSEGSTDGQESGSESGETHLELGRERGTTSGRKVQDKLAKTK